MHLSIAILLFCKFASIRSPPFRRYGDRSKEGSPKQEEMGEKWDMRSLAQIPCRWKRGRLSMKHYPNRSSRSSLSILVACSINLTQRGSWSMDLGAWEERERSVWGLQSESELGKWQKTVDECGRHSGTYPAGAASEPDPPLGAGQPPYPVGSFRVGLGPHWFRAGTPGCGQALRLVKFYSSEVMMDSKE